MDLKLAVIGATSMVGSQATEAFEKSNISVVKGDLNGPNQIDITQKESTLSFFTRNDFDWAILFSAYTNVNGAEEQRNNKSGSCWQTNVDGVKNVVDACLANSKKLIFISSDFIFDGVNGPYSEEDAPGPDLDKVSWYGITKIEGEKIIKDIGDFLILRIAFPYSAKRTGKEDFLAKALNLYKEGNLYPLYDDQMMTPTFIPDVGPAILALLKGEHYGIYNLASPEVTTPYEFVKYAIAKVSGKETDIPSGKLKEQLEKGETTPRPIKGGLKVDKIKPVYQPVSWKEGLEKALDQN